MVEGVVKLLETKLQAATIVALGLDPLDSKSFARVRCAYQEQGQPAYSIDEDTAFVRATPDDNDAVDRQVDVKYIPSGNNDGKTTRRTTWMEVWKCVYTFYGPHASDNALGVRKAIVTGELHDMLSLDGIYFVPDVPPPQRVPEQQDAQWWERVDMFARFNYLVTDDQSDSSIGSVSVEIHKENGLTETVEANQQ